MGNMTGCVLKPGESATSPRVIERVGPYSIISYHALWERSAIISPDEAPPQWQRYRDEYVAKMKTPEDRRYLEVHTGHLIYLKPGEEKYLDEQLIRATTLTGTSDEIIARLRALEEAGLSQISIQIVTNGRETIEEFSRQVIAKY